MKKRKARKWNLWSSNRTFMELKWVRFRTKSLPLSSSNRTFMELKYDYRDKTIFFRDVLIVPLWNWNSDTICLHLGDPSSNRTFMELKFDGCRGCYFKHQKVLIVPLWNWNRILWSSSIMNKKVLIVPLWNWNFYFLFLMIERKSSNRTFMELK